jgi:hypothetical protein
MRQSVAIQLDKVRHLRYGTNALAEAEDLLGRPISAINADNIGVKEIRVLLLVGLMWEDPGLTLTQVGDLIDDAELEFDELGAKIGEAVNMAMAKKK